MSTEEETTAPPVQEIFHLDLHATMDAQQTAHGVRHDDFAQYHGYCTRRLARLSHLPAAKKHLVSSSKFATVKAATGKTPSRHAFCSRQLDTFHEDNTYVPHVNVLWYLLVLTERSWAHANQLQKQKKPRAQVLKKLKKASHWASLLQSKVKLCGDETTKQECEAYVAWIQANHALEKLDYQRASQGFARAMTLCLELSQSNATSIETNKANEDEAALRLARQDLFLTRCDTVLRPLFRYCQYELKQAGEPLMEEPRLQDESTSKSTNATNDEAVITFRGHDLVLESKELRVLLLKLQSVQQESADKQEGKEDDETTETSFLNTLSILDDALEVVQGVLNTLGEGQGGPAVQARRQQYLAWKGYLQAEKTQKVMEHTSNLLKNIKGHAERVHVYDALLQHANTLLLLPRPNLDDAGEEEEEDEFALQVQANILRLRAMKTYHKAWYYFQHPQNYEAAWVLLQHATKLSKRAQEEIAACDEDMPHADEYLEELENLPLASLKGALQAALYLESGASASKTGASTDRRRNTSRPLWLRYHDNDAGAVLAGDLLPIPVPCKPVFYDLALGYALDPSTSIDLVEAYVQEHTEPSEPVADESPSTSGGLLGWFTGN